MTEKYKDFITFLYKNIQSENELDMIIYSIGVAQKISEQYSLFFNQQLQDKNEDDFIDIEVEFETECNKKIYLALGIGDEATLFIECSCQEEYDINHDKMVPTFFIQINKERIARLVLEAMRNDI